MEEHEVVRRREAVLGLGVLGLLGVALVGTVVIRIIEATPRATSGDMASTREAAPQTAPFDLPHQIPYDSSEPIAQDAAPLPAVAATKYESSTEAPAKRDEPPSGGSDRAQPTRRPHFVAPAGRRSR